jgi:hypothetical protein
MYFGQLFPMEDYRVYGSYSNTHHKVVIVCDSTGPENIGVKDTITALAAAFIQAAQNPFQEVGQPLLSAKLDNTIQQLVLKHNNSVQRKR